MIYLDNAATSWPKPEVVYRAVDDCLRNIAANPGRGGHEMARAAGYIIYEAREELASLFGIPDATNLVFTYNATDAINTALFGLLRPGDRVVTTSMEHNAVARPLRYLQSIGVELEIIQCSSTGELDLNRMAEAIRAGTRAVVLSHASNVTGTVMPLFDIGQMAAKQDTVLIVDAAQTAGVEEIDVNELNIGILAFSGHKGLLGPQGTGGLYVRPELALSPLRYGGTGSLSEFDQQPDFLPDRLESGTPNTPGIAGLMAGVRFIRETGLKVIRAQEHQLTEELVEGLKKISGVKLYEPDKPQNRTAVVSFTINDCDSGAIAQRLDAEYGIACRAGLHCAPWAHRTIGTLATGTVRLSPGYYNTSAEIQEAIRGIRQIADSMI